MSVLQAIVLGVIQGLTEFLPISSSAHLVIVPWLLDWRYLIDHPDFNKTFDVALHLGTFLALLVYFWRDILRLLAAWARTIVHRRLDSPEGRLAWLLLVSTIPAGIIGVSAERLITDWLGKPWMIAALLFAFALVMLAADRAARLDRGMDELSWLDALLIGLAQAIALAPGVSRSGVTMVAGLFLRLDRESAARYSFLMSIPVVGGAAAYKGLHVAQSGLPPGTESAFAAGIVAAAVSGFAAIWFLLAYLRRHDFTAFVVYRIAVAAAVALIILLGMRGATGI